MSVNYTPSFENYTGQGKFRFWCQTVLPLIYDDSLSYMELLNKMVVYLNNTIQDVAAVESNVDGLLTAYNNLQQYVNDYFDNLNVQSEINYKLDTMAEDGSLSELIQPFIEAGLPGLVETNLPGVVETQIGGVVAEQIDDVVGDQIGGVVAQQIPTQVTGWLNDNVTPVGSAVVVDSSLTISGAAADAKTVGDELTEINSVLYVESEQQYTVLNDVGIIPSGGGYVVSGYEGLNTAQIPISVGEKYKIYVDGNVRYGFGGPYTTGSTTLYDVEYYETSVSTSFDITITSERSYLYLTTTHLVGVGKIESTIDALDNKIDSETSNLDSKIDTEVHTLDNKIDNAVIISESKSYTVLNDVAIFKTNNVWKIGKNTGYNTIQILLDYLPVKVTFVSNKTVQIGYGGDYSNGMSANDHETITTNDTGSITINSSEYKYLYVFSAASVQSVETIYTFEQAITKTNSRIAYDIKTVKVAASDASEEEKAVADYICDGVDDGAEIQSALNDIVHGVVELSSGTFYLDTLHETSGVKYCIAVFVGGDATGNKAIRGVSRAAYSYETRIVVTADVMTSAGNDNAFIFTCPVYHQYGRTIEYSNFRVYMADNQHKICVLDCSGMSAGMLHDLSINAVMPNIANTSNVPMPVDGCIGIRGFSGNDSGTRNEMQRIFVCGFYEGFQIGGEHLVAWNLSGRYNYYTYTFNNYDWHYGAMSHPITLINCADEHSVSLPLFAKCGWYQTQNHKALQEINLINYNMELISTFSQGKVRPAVEELPGSFCGKIEFTAYGSPNTNENGNKATAGDYGNLTAVKFWGDGSGEHFITRNATHKLVGDTTERNLYIPTFGQQFFDTTLNKMLIYAGSGWVDMNGSAIL